MYNVAVTLYDVCWNSIKIQLHSKHIIPFTTQRPKHQLKPKAQLMQNHNIAHLMSAHFSICLLVNSFIHLIHSCCHRNKLHSIIWVTVPRNIYNIYIQYSLFISSIFFIPSIWAENILLMYFLVVERQKPNQTIFKHMTRSMMNAHDHTMTIQTIELKIDVHAHLYKTVNLTAKQKRKKKTKHENKKTEKNRKIIHSQSVEEKL